MWEDLCNKSIKKGQNKTDAQPTEMVLLLNIDITNVLKMNHRNGRVLSRMDIMCE